MFAIKHVTLAAVVVCLMASVTFGDFASDFEAPDYNGSAAGVLLTDGNTAGGAPGGPAAQQGWYAPAGDDYYVYTYADNPFGMTAVNPTGGDQFAAGPIVENLITYGRGQHDDVLTPGLPVLYGFDFNGKCLLDDPTTATSYVGSFSIQPSAENYNVVMNWTDPGVTYSLMHQARDAANVAIGSPGVVAFDDLLADHWYRQEMILDFDTNLVTEVTLTDLATMEQTTITPDGWYLIGGETRPPENLMPTAFRMFSFRNNDTNANMMAFDNVSAQSIPEPATLCLLGAGVLSVVSARRRRRRVA